MPSFEYKAVSATGQIIQEVVDGASEQSVARDLLVKGLRPISVKAAKSSAAVAKSSSSGFFAPKIKTTELVLFTRQLVTLLKAGVPMLTALEALATQTSKLMGEVLNKIYVDVMSGKSFSQALDKHPKVFPKLYVNSVHAGELSGSLDDVLERLTAVLSHEEETRKKVKSAMKYPIFVVSAMIGAFIILMTQVIPKFKSIFDSTGMALPLPTRIIMGTSEFFSNHILIILGVLIGGGLGLFIYKKTPKGGLWWDTMILKIPLIGPMVLKSGMARFTTMFETLNRSGLPILQTLNTVAQAMGNKVLENTVRQVALGVERGEGIAGTMKKHKVFTPMVVRMIAIGEQSGSLDDMLSSVSQHYDVEVEYAINGLTSMIEPILTLVLGGAVVIMAFGIFLPMWSMTSMVQ
jgi:MSHA biogenesis protein MshG